MEGATIIQHAQIHQVTEPAAIVRQVTLDQAIPFVYRNAETTSVRVLSGRIASRVPSTVVTYLVVYVAINHATLLWGRTVRIVLKTAMSASLSLAKTLRAVDMAPAKRDYVCA